MARILIIEDEEEVRKILTHMLRRAGHDVIDAPDGRVIDKLYNLAPVDLVITDIFMPEKEGIETIRVLRRDFPTTRIIVMSGGSTIESQGLSLNEYLAITKKLGVDRAFEKPFELPEMLKAVNELTGGS